MTKPTISELMHVMRKDWAKPREAIHGGQACPFALQCEFAPPAPLAEIASLTAVPQELSEFWTHTRQAALFKDNQYGQWGLEIFSPLECLNQSQQFQTERSRDVLSGDLIIGAFLGDSDLLLTRTDQDKEDYGRILVATPIDERRQWDVVGTSFNEFLQRYIEEEGSKFWELQGR